MNRQIVVPGEKIGKAKGKVASEGTYVKDKKIYASKIGFVKEKGKGISVVPLCGPYDPKEGDKIIGRIESIKISGWEVDLGIPYKGYLPIGEAVEEYVELPETDLSEFYESGDLVVAKITNISKIKKINLSLKGPEYRKLGKDGRLVKIIPWKIPRLIGRKGSMIKTIKDLTNCKIIIGQNGWVWVKSKDPENELLAVEAIKKVEKESLKDGLTDEIKEMLKERGSK